jgi:hypothetical protein
MARRKLDYPLPYDELPPDVQAKARQWWRDHDGYDDDNMTAVLVEALEYEFGIDVTEVSRKAHDGKRYNEPAIEWESYPFRVNYKAILNIDKVCAHGVPGCEYFSDDAARLSQLWQAAQVLEAVEIAENYTVDWSFKIDGAARVDYRAAWRGPREEQDAVMDDLACAMEKALDAIHDAACKRLGKIFDSEEEYRSSDEYIAELLAGNAWEFDEEGGRV